VQETRKDKGKVTMDGL